MRLTKKNADDGQRPLTTANICKTQMRRASAVFFTFRHHSPSFAVGRCLGDQKVTSKSALDDVCFVGT